MKKELKNKKSNQKSKKVNDDLLFPTPVSKQVVGDIHIQAWLTDLLQGNSNQKEMREEQKEVDSEDEDILRPIPIEDEERKRKILRERLGLKEDLLELTHQPAVR